MAEEEGGAGNGNDVVATPPPPARRNEECDIAQQAVSGASGKNLPRTMDNLSKAYQHSKVCKKCNETLGGFLADLIKQLGVKLPRVTDLSQPREPEYAGQPSTDLTKNVLCPGTVGYDPKDSAVGYKLKPTVSTMALTVEELHDKCRVKDHMIEMMADELRRLRSKCNWSDTNLLSDICDQPTSQTTDFDRRALYNYLNQEPLHSLQTESEIFQEDQYPATNPLGLTVVRQVGPDSLLVKWAPPPETSRVYCFELFINGMFVQRIRSPGRTKTLLHPVDLSSKLNITMNALSYDGETTNVATVRYP
ncbi:hypothetical protein O3M35_005992 [Rhynocoris fuscipes]|uniref:Fibronectin type-III domain-containing protein n=1 Tax=Rhynocoris fuscipes TaxID=488301 RepID=A0AAW1DE85_9HEMI